MRLPLKSSKKDMNTIQIISVILALLSIAISVIAMLIHK